MSTHPSCGCVSRSMSVPLFTCKHLASTYCVPDPVLTLRLHEHKATAPGAGPGEPPQSPASPPLTSQQGFSSPRASGGPSILPARPPGLPGDWHSRLGGGQGHRSWGGCSRWGGVCWERLDLTHPHPNSLQPAPLKYPHSQPAQGRVGLGVGLRTSSLRCVCLGESLPSLGLNFPCCQMGEGEARGAPWTLSACASVGWMAKPGQPI